jgi:hypothetical protein
LVQIHDSKTMDSAPPGGQQNMGMITRVYVHYLGLPLVAVKG